MKTKFCSILLGLVAALALAGCATTGSTTTATASGTKTSDSPAATGRACAKCVCSHFEPQSDAATVCRMCGHALADHTR